MRYRRGTPLGPLHLEGRIDREEGRKVFVVATISDAEGVTVEATGCSSSRSRAHPEGAVECAELVRRRCDGPSSLMAARPGPDLAAHGWTETEYVVTRHRARRTPATSPPTAARRSPSRRGPVRDPVRGAPPGATRARSAARWSSSGSTSAAAPTPAPDWTYLSDEIVRRGHVWVGVSAQYVGVEGGSGSGRRPAAPSAAEGRRALRRARPPRRRLLLRHLHRGRRRAHRLAAARPGRDLPAGGGGVAVGVRADDLRQRRAAADRPVRRLPHPLAAAVPTMPLGEPGRAVDLADFRNSTPDRWSATTSTCRSSSSRPRPT